MTYSVNLSQYIQGYRIKDSKFINPFFNTSKKNLVLLLQNKFFDEQDTDEAVAKKCLNIVNIFLTQFDRYDLVQKDAVKFIAKRKNDDVGTDIVCSESITFSGFVPKIINHEKGLVCQIMAFTDRKQINIIFNDLTEKNQQFIKNLLESKPLLTNELQSSYSNF